MRYYVYYQHYSMYLQNNKQNLAIVFFISNISSHLATHLSTHADIIDIKNTGEILYDNLLSFMSHSPFQPAILHMVYSTVLYCVSHSLHHPIITHLSATPCKQWSDKQCFSSSYFSTQTVKSEIFGHKQSIWLLGYFTLTSHSI